LSRVCASFAQAITSSVGGSGGGAAVAEVEAEACGCVGRLHLGADARHFRQAGLVDLVGGHVGGGELLDYRACRGVKHPQPALAVVAVVVARGQQHDVAVVLGLDDYRPAQRLADLGVLAPLGAREGWTEAPFASTGAHTSSVWPS